MRIDAPGGVERRVGKLLTWISPAASFFDTDQSEVCPQAGMAPAWARPLSREIHSASQFSRRRPGTRWNSR